MNAVEARRANRRSEVRQRGRIRLGTAAAVVEGGTGDYLVIPAERHNLAALEDSVVLLTVVKRR